MNDRSHTFHSKRLLGAILLALCGAIPALAQAGGTPPSAAPAGGGSSMWTVVARGIEWPAFFILAGSIAAIALIVEHFITVRAQTICPPEQVKRAREMIERRMFRESLEAAKKSSTFFARIMAAALHHARHGFDAMHEAALDKSNELGGQMFRKVEYMNILGNLGPLMGLLGTVYGMIKAFSALAAGGGEAGTDAGGLAEGISLALVNTLLGLMLAIVGLFFFGICRNRIDSLTIHATVQALDLLEYFRPVGAASQAAETRRPPTPAPPAPPASRPALTPNEG